MSRFKDLVKSGLLKAEEVERNLNQIESIFSDLNNEVREQSNRSVSFLRVEPDTLTMWTNAMKPDLNPKKEGRLALKNHSDVLDVVAYWEQSPDGYPFTIKYEGQRHDCWDEESLVNILGSIISSGAFWIRVNKIKNQF